MSGKKIIFVTGTDTGVGKTLFSALLLHHFRQSGVRALAMKPFCSGGRADVRLLQSLQPGELSGAEMNPFYFSRPLAPLAALEKGQKSVRLSDVIARINHAAAQCDRLIVEGSGGLLVPLGRRYTVADVIAALDCQVVVVARNRLGVINHTLLTIAALKSMGVLKRRMAVVLMSVAKPDLSSLTNVSMLTGLLHPLHVSSIPFLGQGILRAATIKNGDFGPILKDFPFLFPAGY